jgi:probable phosphoglycerate mutase
VLVVRHGATEWSRLGRHTGLTDLALDAGGEREARNLGPLVAARLAAAGPLGSDPLVLSSPLRRALDTAALILPGRHVEALDGLREMDYGRYEGRTAAEITAERPDWELFRDGTPDGEGLAQVVARCDATVAKLERISAGRAAVLVTHGHLGRVLVSRLLGLPGAAATALHHDTGSLGVVEWRRTRYVLTGWNERGRGASGADAGD